MADYFSLPLELRQQILFHAFARADKQDAQSALRPFRRLFKATRAFRKINILIGYHGQVRLSDDPIAAAYRKVLPVYYSPEIDKLIKRLSTAQPLLKADLAYVVNKWADVKKDRPNVELVRDILEKQKYLPQDWGFWTLGLPLPAGARTTQDGEDLKAAWDRAVAIGKPYPRRRPQEPSNE